MVTDSCFAAHLGKYLDLTDEEIRSLERLEENRRSVRKGQIIQRENDPSAELFIVSSGRLMSYVILPDGQRQILRVYFPGDFVGATAAAYAVTQEWLVAATDAVLCPFDKPSLRQLITEQPRLAVLMFILSQTERAALTDRLTSIGRASAKARVSAFLLDIIDRLRITDSDITDTFELRLTQEEIGDAVGLTSVHVNRMIRQLEEEGLIARRNGSLQLIDEERLRQIGHYTNRYANLDLEWLATA